jgi:hypothetical protein
MKLGFDQAAAGSPPRTPATRDTGGKARGRLAESSSDDRTEILPELQSLRWEFVLFLITVVKMRHVDHPGVAHRILHPKLS